MLLFICLSLIRLAESIRKKKVIEKVLNKINAFFVISYKYQAVQIFNFAGNINYIWQIVSYPRWEIIVVIPHYFAFICRSSGTARIKSYLWKRVICISSFPSYVKLTCERTAKNNIKKLPEDKRAKSSKRKSKCCGINRNKIEEIDERLFPNSKAFFSTTRIT